MKRSIVTKFEDISAFSGLPAEHRHHLCFGSGIRPLAENDGLWIPLLAREHNIGSPTECIHGNPAAEHLSRMAGQLAWEKEQYRKAIMHNDEDPAREAFMKRYGVSYL